MSAHAIPKRRGGENRVWRPSYPLLSGVSSGEGSVRGGAWARNNET